MMGDQLNEEVGPEVVSVLYADGDTPRELQADVAKKKRVLSVERHALRELAEEDADEEGPLPSYGIGDIDVDAVRPEWDGVGWWMHGDHGMVGGPEKSFKSWLGTVQDVALASGYPLMGVGVRQTPVLVFTAEGSRTLWKKRVRHVGRAMGLSDAEIDKLPIAVIDKVAKLRTPRFQRTLRAFLDDGVGFVRLDPLYPFIGGGVEAGNVFDMGSVLTELSEQTGEYGASLQVMHHFNKVGAHDLTLSSLTQAGAREWVQSWVLIGHREPPNVLEGVAKLKLVVGGREWGGTRYEVDLNTGPFNRATLSFERPMEMTMREITHADADAEASPVEVIMDAVRDEPGTMTKKDLAGLLSVKTQDAYKVINGMVLSGLLRLTTTVRVNARGHRRNVEVYEVGELG